VQFATVECDEDRAGVVPCHVGGRTFRALADAVLAQRGERLAVEGDPVSGVAGFHLVRDDLPLGERPLAVELVQVLGVDVLDSETTDMGEDPQAHLLLVAGCRRVAHGQAAQPRQQEAAEWACRCFRLPPETRPNGGHAPFPNTVLQPRTALHAVVEVVVGSR
jgi:hypothetical protein